MAEKQPVKFNDEEMAKYAKCFNELCAKNKIADFWWDTNFLIKREQQQTFPKVIKAIMDCYSDFTLVTEKDENGFETAAASVHNMKTGWNLGNTFDAHKSGCSFNEQKNCWEETFVLKGITSETCWHMPRTTPQMIHYVKDGINEILDEKASWADPTKNASLWADKWNQLFVDAVRATGGKNKYRNLVVMGPAGKSSKVTMEQFNMPEDVCDNHLIFEFHNYDLQSFCWPQNREGTNNLVK